MADERDRGARAAAGPIMRDLGDAKLLIAEPAGAETAERAQARRQALARLDLALSASRPTVTGRNADRDHSHEYPARIASERLVYWNVEPHGDRRPKTDKVTLSDLADVMHEAAEQGLSVALGEDAAGELRLTCGDPAGLAAAPTSVNIVLRGVPGITWKQMARVGAGARGDLADEQSRKYTRAEWASYDSGQAMAGLIEATAPMALSEKIAKLARGLDSTGRPLKAAAALAARAALSDETQDYEQAWHELGCVTYRPRDGERVKEPAAPPRGTGGDR